MPQYPIPAPGVSDDFSYILIADTLRHFRLANPPHQLHQFFETFFALQQPAYGSIFPLGQGPGDRPRLDVVRPSVGRRRAQHRRTLRAVLLDAARLDDAWLGAHWRLASSDRVRPAQSMDEQLLGRAQSRAARAAWYLELCPACENLAAGETPRCWGLGLALQLLTRPFESIFLLISVPLFFLPDLRRHLRRLARPAAIAALVVVPAIGLILLQNKQATGSWTTLPYVLSRYQYGVPTTFTVQPLPTPHLPLDSRAAA